jgi:hypothetical protein
MAPLCLHERSWFSGKISAPHAEAPGSIPGGRIFHVFVKVKKINRKQLLHNKQISVNWLVFPHGYAGYRAHTRHQPPSPASAPLRAPGRLSGKVSENGRKIVT